MEIFKTHPSVRVKGTEDNYEPVACSIQECPKRSPHMHCPFCLKTDSFIDPVILKAHYRVKHVDKGIEFAGLKILRCCDQCSIVGSIKNCKEFKGAHWHCYNCRNGFNRRDEALKHYKTHFRNPMTTFQIQITHDINQHMMRLPQQVELDHALECLPEEGGGLFLPKTHPWVVSNETIISSVSETADLSQEDSVMNSTHDATSKEIGLTSTTTEGVPRLILVEPHQQGPGGGQEETQYFIVGENGKLTAAEAPLLTSQQALTESFSQSDQLEKEQLVARISELQNEFSDMERLYQEKVTALQNQVDEQQKKIASLEQREQELLNQLRQNLSEQQVSDILSEMKLKQEELLHQCLNRLKRSKVASRTPSDTMVTTANSSSIISVDSNPLNVADSTQGVHSSQGDICDCLTLDVVTVSDSTSHSVEPAEASDLISSGNVKVERTSKRIISENLSHSNVEISVTPSLSSEVEHSAEEISGIIMDTESSRTSTESNSKVAKLPLSRLFTSMPATPENKGTNQGQVYFLVQTSDGSEVSGLESQNGGFISKDSDSGGISSSTVRTTDSVGLNEVDRQEELVTTHSDDIIKMGDYVSTSNVDVITEVTTTDSELDLNGQEQVLEAVDYSNSDVCIVPNTAMSEHQYAVIEQNIEIHEDGISSDQMDLKIVTLRKGKRKASTSPETSPVSNRSKRHRKPLVKDSL